MRNVVLAMAMAAACGPSNAEVKTARTATYSADPRQVFQLAMQATQDTYKVGDVNEAELTFITQPKYFSKEGDLESPGAEGFVHLRAGSLQVQFIVAVVSGEDHHASVTVTPKTFQVVGGSPKPRELAPEDPYLPPFVLGRADSLSLAIYDRAKPYAMAPPGRNAP